MAEKDKNEKRIVKSNKPKNIFQKIGAFAVRLGKRLKSFFINLKAELKRVVWPDRKRLIQNTATVLAICLIAGLILFIVDSVLGGVLNAVGFYAPDSTTTTTATTAGTETTTSDTSAAATDTTTAEVTTGTAAG